MNSGPDRATPDRLRRLGGLAVMALALALSATSAEAHTPTIAVSEIQLAQLTYAYFITEEFPFIPRCFFGQPIEGAVILEGIAP